MSEANEKQTTQTTKKTEPTYKVDQFIQNSRKLFSVPPEVIIGALSGIDKDEFTKNEVKRAIDQFMKKKVK